MSECTSRRREATAWLSVVLAIIGSVWFCAPVFADIHVLLVVGLAGDDTQQQLYQSEVDGWNRWLAAIGINPENVSVKGSSAIAVEGPSFRTQVIDHLEGWRSRLTRADDAIMVLIGYGVSREGQYQFQNRGPRLTGADIDSHLTGNARSYTVFVTGPGGANLARSLAGERRAIISATATPTEINQTQFGRLLVEAAAEDPRMSLADLMRTVEEKVIDYYSGHSLARTEHAQLTVGVAKPVEAPFLTGFPPAIENDWTLSNPGAWAENPAPAATSQPVAATTARVKR